MQDKDSRSFDLWYRSVGGRIQGRYGAGLDWCFPQPGGARGDGLLWDDPQAHNVLGEPVGAAVRGRARTNGSRGGSPGPHNRVFGYHQVVGEAEQVPDPRGAGQRDQDGALVGSGYWGYEPEPREE